MTGKPGRSGGARPGAGPKPKLGPIIGKLEAYQNNPKCPLTPQQQREVNAVKSRLIQIMEEVGEE